ncbi:MAG: imidazole glycerol phosphate synthase subunit HisH, partial [Porticoccaceae bacterium]
MSDFRSHIAVIDYGMGNLHSVAKALEHVCPGAKVSITADPAVVEDADRVVFPGVGAIRDCMGEIRRLNVGDVVSQAMKTKPVLAICVGMQALMEHSEENGGVDCLGLLPGRVKFFGNQHVDAAGAKLKVPHMGWNNVHQTIDHPLWQGIDQDSRFYFVHSYFVAPSEPQH